MKPDPAPFQLWKKAGTNITLMLVYRDTFTGNWIAVIWYAESFSLPRKCEIMEKELKQTAGFSGAQTWEFVSYVPF